jgi:cell division protein FtsB
LSEENEALKAENKQLKTRIKELEAELAKVWCRNATRGVQKTLQGVSNPV